MGNPASLPLHTLLTVIHYLLLSSITCIQHLSIFHFSFSFHFPFFPPSFSFCAILF